MALSLYNKYRPQVFSDVVGQQHVSTTLANAVEKKSVSHAYLFCGPRGTGKTTTARILAKALLCAQAPTASPDGTCEQCKEISEGVHPDVFELDAASRTGVDNVREEIISRVKFAPTHGAYKFYIIDEVHMLSTSAFNALLKTLEEPPPHVIFVLCTTDVHKVIDTVQARCQRFDFRRIAVRDIVKRLQYICEREGFDNESAALELIAQRSQGGMRDAIRSLEQVAIFNAGKVTYTAAESLLGMVDAEQLFLLGNNLAARDAAACFDWVAGYVQSGSDIAVLVNDLAMHVRTVYAVSLQAAGRAHGTDEQLANALELDAAMLPKLREQAAAFGTPERLAWILTVVGTLSTELKYAVNARLALEVALTRITRPGSAQDIDALVARVAELERILSEGEEALLQREKTGFEAAPNNQGRSLVTPAKSSLASRDFSAAAASTVSSATSSNPSATTDPSVISHHPSGVSAEAGGNNSPTEVTAVQDTQNQEAQTPPHSASAAQEEEDLYRRWYNVVDAFTRERPAAGASLGGVRPLMSKGGKKLTLEFPTQAATSKKTMETEANKALLHKTVTTIFGQPLEIALSLALPGIPSVPGAAQQAPEPSKAELESMLANSTNSQISFEEL